MVISTVLEIQSGVAAALCHRAPNALAAAIGRISKGTQQQRHMIMLRWIFNMEDNADLRIERLDLEFGEVRFSVEDEPVSARLDGLLKQKEWFDAPVFIGPGVAELRPALIRILHFKRDGNGVRGSPAGDIKNVRGDAAH